MHLVVIGGVAAGLSAAARARRIDPGLEITVLERGHDISWAACGLPYYVEGRVSSLDDLKAYTPERFAAERDVRVRTGAEATRILHARREVHLASGERVPYDRLVIATGARGVDSGITGAEQPYVFQLRTLNDGRRLKQFLDEKRPRHSVVVGAGYTSLEMVDALHAHGISTTLVTGDSAILGRRDAIVVETVAATLKRYGVAYRPNTEVKMISGASVAGIACDVVILGVGIRPNVELAAEAGVAVGATGAIRVSPRMETNLTGVFAAGDCAETKHLVSGRPCWIPLGDTANKMGRVAGACAAGARETFPGVVGTSIVSVLGLGVGLTGLAVEEARSFGFDAVAASIEDRDRPGYYGGPAVKVELVGDRRTGRLLGGTVAGEEGSAKRVNVIATALHASMKVEQFEQLDLAYAPPFSPVWDPLLVAARELRKRM